MITPSTARELCRAMLETDSRYFELGARLHPLPRGVYSVMEGLESLMSASVVHRVDTETLPFDFAPWLDHVENMADQLGLQHTRVYLNRSNTLWNEILQPRLFQGRTEEILACETREAAAPDDITLVRVESPSEWNLRAGIFEDRSKGADGHDMMPAAWNNMERRKAATGEFHCFLAFKNGVPVGTVGYLRNDGLFRIKNLYVRSDVRNRGVATEMVRHMCCMAHAEGAKYCGLMAVNPGPALALYQRLGFTPVGQQFEWIKHRFAHHARRPRHEP